MKITHKALSAVSNITASMAGFTLTTMCHAIILDNVGDDDAKVYFNDDAVNYAVLKAGESIAFDNGNDFTSLLYDTIKITFDTTSDPIVNIQKQTKSLIV